MDVIIGSARSDESKKYSGGKKGDQRQTANPDYSGEVSMQTFYNHSKGWIVLRAKSDTVAQKLSDAMKRACNNSNIGYNQSDRYSLLYVGTNTTSKVNCDCSSLVRQCIKEATGKDIGDFNTYNEADKLVKSGFFEKIPFTKKSNLYDGDVLVTKSKGHTVIVVSAKPRTVNHIQLNYEKNQDYTVITTALNVRKKPVDGEILYAVKKGSILTCLDTEKVGGAIWMYLGKDSYGREKWCCADNGTKRYVE